MTHTPKPWYFNKGGSNNKPTPDDCFGSIVGDDWILAEVKNDGPNPEADARLIAAAPDLLAALEQMVEAFDDGAGGIVDDARAAIEDAKS